MTRIFGLFLALVWLPLAAAAQDDDQGFLAGLIEDNLSGAGRDVQIRGFAGALSSRATLDEMTIADEQGVWLTLRGAVLDWNRGALLRGRLEVRELTAEELILPRLPVSSGEPGVEAPPAAASGFKLPELPVSVSIGSLAIRRVDLGEPLFGAAAVVSLDGSVSLADGTGEAALAVERVDGRRGALSLDASYVNATEALGIELILSEAEDGIAANLIGLPGRPSVDLSVVGDGTLDDFTADIGLDTDGQERLAGEVTLLAEPGDDPAGPPTRRFRADLGGDIAPVFTPQYRPFFGPDIRLAVTGARLWDGRTVIDDLRLRAESLRLEGSLEIAADGLPRTFRLTGEIANAEGTPVLLPVGDSPTRIDRADIALDFDAAAGDRWTGRAVVEGLDRPELTAEALTLDGEGVIRRGGDAGDRVTAALDFDGTGVRLADPELSAALGTELQGTALIVRDEGAPVVLERFRLTGDGYRMDASGEVAGQDRDLTVSGEARLSLDALSQFASLAGRELGGSLEAELSGSFAALGGAFEVDLTGRAGDLRFGIPEVDALTEGESVLRLVAARDATGTRIESFRLASDHVEATGSGLLQSDGSRLALDARLDEIARVVPSLAGPATLRARGRQRGETWDIDVTADGPAGSRATVDGALSSPLADPVFEGLATLVADNLAPFSELAGRRLGGGVTAEADGRFAVSDRSFRVAARIDGRDLRIDQRQVDRLLAGQSRIEAVAEGGDGRYVLDRFEAESPALSASGQGRIGTEDDALSFSARLRDAAVLELGLRGPVSVVAEADAQGGDVWAVDLTAEAPGNSRATVQGTLDAPLSDPAFDGRIRASADTLAPFSTLAGRSLGGGVDAEAEGRVRLSPLDFRIAADVTGRNLRIGQAEADRLLAGSSRLTATVAGSDGRYIIERLRAVTPQLTVNADGQAGADRNAVTFDARLANLGLFAEGISGPLSVDGRAAQSRGGDWQLNVTANGPAGSTVRASGSVAPDVSRADLDIGGSAPLALAGRFVQPNSIRGTVRFDLGLNGRPAVESLSGTIRVDDARVVLPRPGIVLNAVATNTVLTRGRANVSATAQVQGGGRISVEGPVTLSPPFSAELIARLIGINVSDPNLYETSLDGEITVSGPLTGGARIGGTVQLGRTEIRIPSGQASSVGEIPDLQHRNEPAAVRQTRARAGLIGNGGGDGNGGSGGGGRAFPLDILIVADNQVFIRGRGLDAEMGGRLRITGTSRNVIPSGRFELLRGRMDLLNQRINLDEGSARLEGAFVPVIRLVASSEVDGTVVFIVVEGPASEPEITFRSEPELPQDEVLALLLFGHGIDEISPLQAAQLASAVATLAGRGGGGIVSRLRENFGLDDLDVTVDEEGNAGVRAGRYLSENVYTDVTVSNGTSEINLNLDISPNVTAKGRVTSTGETGIGIFFERDY